VLLLGRRQVTGKAMVLDEIINYVQSLQNQVEVIKTQTMKQQRRYIYMFVLKICHFIRHSRRQLICKSHSHLLFFLSFFSVPFHEDCLHEPSAVRVRNEQ
jgi:Sec-independent protein secretion pathway component TatC